LTVSSLLQTAVWPLFFFIHGHFMFLPCKDNEKKRKAARTAHRKTAKALKE
jgi:hypothetical protein